MDLIASLRSVIHPLHREGVKFVLLFLFVTLVLFVLWAPLGWIGLVFSAWCFFFFRDPPRVTPLAPGLVIAPADGRIVHAGPAEPPAELGLGPETRARISIFMSVFDVHVNRSPIDATVDLVAYTPGAFVSAEQDKASDENERNGLRLMLADGRSLGVVQIAGMVARRIVCDASPGRSIKAGERFGIIRFGSRVDVYLPPGVNPLVAVGQRAVGGETVLADLDQAGPARAGEIR